MLNGEYRIAGPTLEATPAAALLDVLVDDSLDLGAERGELLGNLDGPRAVLDIRIPVVVEIRAASAHHAVPGELDDLAVDTQLEDTGAEVRVIAVIRDELNGRHASHPRATCGQPWRMRGQSRR